MSGVDVPRYRLVRSLPAPPQQPLELDAGQRVVVEHPGGPLLVHERLGTGEDVLDIRRANVYRIQDDKIVEIRIFEADQYAIDTWFSRAQSDVERPAE